MNPKAYTREGAQWEEKPRNPSLQGSLLKTSKYPLLVVLSDCSGLTKREEETTQDVSLAWVLRIATCP